MKKIFKIAGVILFILLVGVLIFTKLNRISPVSWGIHSKVNQPMFSDEAINGYDPVAYFTQNKAIKGDKEISYQSNGATWYFSSKEDLELFKKEPEKYMPQFGGYCAYAVSKGFTANCDPASFKIIDNKLYLFAEPKFENEFSKENDALKKAGENWK